VGGINSIPPSESIPHGKKILRAWEGFAQSLGGNFYIIDIREK
jgi:hypothetical protein